MAQTHSDFIKVDVIHRTVLCTIWVICRTVL